MQMVGARWRSGDLVIHHITLLSLSLSVCLTLSGWGGGQVSRPCFVIDGRVGIQKIAAGWILHRQWGKNNYNLVPEVNGLWAVIIKLLQSTRHVPWNDTWHFLLSVSQGKVGHFNLAEWLCMTIERCLECPVRNNKEAICQQTRHQEERSELFIMMEMIEPGMARINQEEIFSSTGRIFNWSGCGGCGVK